LFSNQPFPQFLAPTRKLYHTIVYKNATIQNPIPNLLSKAFLRLLYNNANENFFTIYQTCITNVVSFFKFTFESELGLLTVFTSRVGLSPHFPELGFG
jgi:hypothetical protein